MANLQSSKDNILGTIYKPSELLGLFSSYLSRQEINSQVIFLRGIYLKNPKHDPRWAYKYDVLRDEDTQTEITLQISDKLSKELRDGNLITVGGVLGKRVQNNSHIQLMLVVSRIEVVQEQVVDENELKRIEFRRKKVQCGFKNVDGILEQKLFLSERPKVVLVLATTSITMSDFNAGINAAKSAIDFFEQRVNFANTKELITLLRNLDQKKYDAIALVRGGGGGIDNLDELEVLETVVELHTPIIAAVGHVEEKLFIKQIVDKEAPTPNGLGQYFSDMVENVNEKKNKSQAVLTERIKKQFQEQLVASQKQNKELQEKLVNLTKAQESAQKLHKEQFDTANKQNQELQKKLVEISKANENAQKAHAEQMTKLQTQLKVQVEQSNKQSTEFNDNLKKMQETNGELNKSLQKLTAQNTQTAKDLNESKEKARELEKQLEDAKLKANKGCLSGCMGIVTAIVTIIGVACYALCLIL